MPVAVSDNGQRIAGIYDESNLSPYWAWDKTNFAKTGDVAYLGGYGLFGAISGNGRVIGGTVQGPYLLTDWDGVVLYQQRAALWTKETGWKQLANADWDGCDIFQTSILDLSTDGSTAVGWHIQGMRLLSLQVDRKIRHAVTVADR